MKLSITKRLPIVAIGAFTLLAAGAQATHWPQPGADIGRSGHQPADRAVLPMNFVDRLAEAVHTSPIITSGDNIAAQRVVYGRYTTDGEGTDLNARVRIANFSSVDSLHNVDIDDEQPREGGEGTSDPDAFGPAGDVAPVEASGHTTGPTQLYALHNDDNQQNFDATAGPNGTASTTPNLNGNDIALAQIDVASGARVRDFAIGSNTPGGTPTTHGFTVESAPVIGPDSGTGERTIFFVARSATEKRIFKLVIPNAAATTTNDFTVQASASIPDLNTKARPALLTLTEPDSGTPVTMVAVATTDGVRTFRASSPNLSDAGPSISGLGTTWSPAAPVLSAGNAPSPTTHFYVASSTAGSGTVVSKLQQEPGTAGEEALKNLEVVDASPELSGTPGPAMALAQEVAVSGERPKPGRVVVGTSANIFSLNTENLSAGSPPQVFSQDVEAGYGQTVPATSGDLGFAVNKNGQQIAFYLTPRNGSLHIPTASVGIPNELGFDASSSVGQPAVSRGRVVFGTNIGAYLYGPSLSVTSPAPAAPVQGTTALSAHTLDPNATQIVFKVDGQTVGTGTVTGGVASVNWNSTSVDDGEHLVTAETATDKSAQRPIIVDNFKPPTAVLTISPTIGNVGQDVTLNASGSAPTAGEANDALKEWAFEIDGDNDFDDIVETASSPTPGIVTTQFSTPGSKTVSVRVTDGHGDTAIDTETFRVNAPPSVSLSVTPNPVAAGQQVTADATGSTDPDGSITKYEFDFDGNNTFETDNGTNPKATKPIAATANVGVRVTDNEGGQTIKTVTVNVTPPNQAPVASFIVAPNPAVTNQEVGFSAVASKDPDGKIDKYEWDFDANGSFERSTGAVPLAAHRFTTAGVFKVGLRVTDNQGATGTTTVDVIVSVARCVVGNRCSPRLTASVTPRSDRRLPLRFTTRGRVGLPTGVRTVDGCTGRVSVQVKRGKRTISNRRVKVRSNCRFTSKLTLRDRKRLGSSKTLRFKVRFLGNRVLKPRSTTTKTVRIR